MSEWGIGSTTDGSTWGTGETPSDYEYSDAAASNDEGILNSIGDVFTKGLEAWVDIETLDRRLSYQSEIKQLESNPNTGKAAPLPVGQTNYLPSAQSIVPALLVGGGLIMLAKMAKVF